MAEVDTEAETAEISDEEDIFWLYKVKFDGLWAYYNWVLCPLYNWVICPICSWFWWLLSIPYHWIGLGIATPEEIEAVAETA